MTTDRAICACHGHYEELRAELQSLRTAVTSPSTGRSWASIVSQLSVVSSNTRMVRSSLGLPAVVLDLRSANEETKALVDDPTRTREKVRAALKEETTASNVEIVGVKPNPELRSRSLLIRKKARHSYAEPLTG